MRGPGASPLLSPAQESTQTCAQINLTPQERKLERVRSCCVSHRAVPLGTAAARSNTLFFICHTQACILSAAQARRKPDYSEFHTSSGQEHTFLKAIQVGTCFACLCNSPSRRLTRANLLLPTFLPIFQPEAPSQKGISFSQNQGYLSAFCSSTPIHRFTRFWRPELTATEVKPLL